MESGTGTIKFAYHAQMDSSSTHKDHALLFLHSVLHGIQMVPVLTATKDTIFKMEDAPLLLFKDLLISDVDNGTGIIKFVLNAHSDILMEPMDFVLQYHHSALHGIQTVPALLALLDTH